MAKTSRCNQLCNWTILFKFSTTGSDEDAGSERTPARVSAKLMSEIGPYAGSESQMDRCMTVLISTDFD